MESCEVSVVKGQHFILHWIKLCFQMQNVKVEVGQNKTVWTWNKHGSPKTWGFLPSHYHRLLFFFSACFLSLYILQFFFLSVLGFSSSVLQNTVDTGL